MNKEKKLKLILSSFKQKQLIKFFQIFLDAIKCKFYKSIKQISFSCYESTCQVENFMVNGYGKTSSQALISGINNLIDCLIEQEQYCQVMRQCLRRINISPYGLNNNTNTTSKKQLLSTEKTLKTVGAQPSGASLQKKVLTMSANLSTNSKDSSSKAKSIKDQIFEYFNLQNLKVKNPTQPFTTSTPMGANTKISQKNSLLSSQHHNNMCRSKQKYPVRQPQHSNNTSSHADKQLEQVLKRIKEVQQKIQGTQKQNKKLKQQIENRKRIMTSSTGNKNTMNVSSHSTNQTNGTTVTSKPSFPLNNSTNNNNNYFTRPSFPSQNDKDKNTNTTKKPILLSSQSKNLQSNKKITYMQMSLNENTQNNYVKENNTTKYQMRKCLVDISNLNGLSNNSINNGEEQMSFGMGGGKNGGNSGQHSAFSSAINAKLSQQKTHTSFQTVNNSIKNNSYTNNNQRTPNHVLYSKCSQQQESMSIIQSSKKLRSFSVQNSLAEKVTSYSTNVKNPMAILSGGISAQLNSSYDNAANTLNTSSNDMMNISANIGQKKLKIPKLNLQILPNYHGKSNKSLNQSLMETYEKKNQQQITIGQINQ